MPAAKIQKGIRTANKTLHKQPKLIAFLQKEKIQLGLQRRIHSELPDFVQQPANFGPEDQVLVLVVMPNEANVQDKDITPLALYAISQKLYHPKLVIEELDNSRLGLDV